MQSDWENNILKGYKETVAAQMQDLQARQQAEVAYASQADDRAASAGGRRSRFVLELRKKQAMLLQQVGITLIS